MLSLGNRVLCLVSVARDLVKRSLLLNVFGTMSSPNNLEDHDCLHNLDLRHNSIDHPLDGLDDLNFLDSLETLAGGLRVFGEAVAHHDILDDLPLLDMLNVLHSLDPFEVLSPFDRVTLLESVHPLDRLHPLDIRNMLHCDLCVLVEVVMNHNQMMVAEQIGTWALGDDSDCRVDVNRLGAADFSND